VIGSQTNKEDNDSYLIKLIITPQAPIFSWYRASIDQ